MRGPGPGSAAEISFLRLREQVEWVGLVAGPILLGLCESGHLTLPALVTGLLLVAAAAYLRLGANTALRRVARRCLNANNDDRTLQRLLRHGDADLVDQHLSKADSGYAAWLCPGLPQALLNAHSDVRGDAVK